MEAATGTSQRQVRPALTAQQQQQLLPAAATQGVVALTS
jgi:hypothetical protein